MSGFWNLPNLLTYLRILLVPVMVLLLLDPPGPAEARVALGVFLGAMFTDLLDGWIARRWQLTSVLGAFLDPLADKLMVVTTLLMLLPLGRAPAWLVALLLGRELTITALRAIAVSEGLVLAADVTGKAKTAFQTAALAFLLWHDPIHMSGFTVDAHSVGIVLLYVATGFALWSGVGYLATFFRHVAETG